MRLIENPMRSAYTVATVEAQNTVLFLCITDLDLGRSVTNDIERVLVDQVQAGNLQPGMRVIYRDTMHIWDEVVISDTCTFVNFRSLNMATRDEAIKKAMRLGTHQQ
jgi:hypothetical protein